MKNLENLNLSNPLENPEEELKVPRTLSEMESALEDVCLQLDTIKAFSKERNAGVDSLKQVEYGNRILQRMKVFLGKENDAALNSRLKKIKTILDNNGSLSNVKEIFTPEQEKAA